LGDGDAQFRIPLAAPNLDEKDRVAMVQALKRPDQLAYGPRVACFEQAMADRLGGTHAVAVQSGTAALHLALLTAGVGPGDDVLLPTLAFAAPANAIRLTGATPLFCDAEGTHRQLDVPRAAALVKARYRGVSGALVSRASGRRLAALLNVHLLGHPSDLDAVLALGNELGVPVIDDAAEALGAEVHGRPVGAIAPLSVLSFNVNKLITTCGGGMVLCDDEQAAERVRLLAAQGRVPGSKRYLHREVGFNYRMTSPQAALGLSQLGRLDAFLARKRATARRYARLLDGVAEIALPTEASWARESCWLYTVHVEGVDRDALMDALALRGIETRPMFEPMHRTEAHRAEPSPDCPVAERLSDSGICLPCSTAITDPQIDEVAEVLRNVLSGGHAVAAPDSCG